MESKTYAFKVEVHITAIFVGEKYPNTIRSTIIIYSTLGENLIAKIKETVGQRPDIFELYKIKIKTIVPVRYCEGCIHDEPGQKAHMGGCLPSSNPSSSSPSL